MAEPWDPETLTPWLAGLPSGATLWVAFSGGLDSTALLHGVVAARTAGGPALAAAHVHHGLHPDADAWARHCAVRCGALGVPLRTLRVDARAGPRESPEDAARRARYRALAQLMGPGDLLCTAHTRDDQVETLLLALLRGSGPRGLAAMPERIALGAGLQGRPLLQVPRAALEAYARRRGLSWLEDPANRDAAFHRNRIRHEVLPVLRAMRAGADGALARAARLQADAAAVLEQVGREDLDRLLEADGTLAVEALAGLPGPRGDNLLRAWVRRAGLPAPAAAHLEALRRVLAAQGPGRAPLVDWPGAAIGCWRGRLWLLRPAPAPRDLDLPWQPEAPLALPHGVLRAEPLRGAGVPWRPGDEALRVRLRRGGERCAAGGHHRTLKALCQERGIPPWLRPRIPLVYAGERLVAVAGVAACGPPPAPGEPGLRLYWRDAMTALAPQEEPPAHAESL